MKAAAGRGAYASARELAAGEEVKPSYAAGVLQLTLLASAIIEAISSRRDGG